MVALKYDILEVFRNINHDWLLYASSENVFFDKRTFKKIKSGTCVGISFSDSSAEIEEVVLFKHIQTTNPSKLKKSLDTATKWNIMEGSQQKENDLDYFSKPNKPSIEIKVTQANEL
jgi:hypothetical protein